MITVLVDKMLIFDRLTDIKTIDGGIICPKVPAAHIVPLANFESILA